MHLRKIPSLYGWIKTLKWVVTNRGNDSYGKQDIVYSLRSFKAMRKSNLQNLILAEEFVGKLLKDFWPKNSPLNLRRVGPIHDSGYLIAVLEKCDNLVSGGAGKNIDFEINFAEKGCRVHICDPYVKKLPNFHNNIRHYQILLETFTNNKKIRKFSLKDFEEIIGLKPDEVNFLKLDIEGSEVNLLGLTEVNLDHYDEIVIELHDMYNLTDENFRNKIKILKSNLLKNHQVIAFNGNNNGLLLNFGKYLIPEIFELTLLHNKFFSSIINKTFHSTNVLQDSFNNPNRLPLLNIFTYMDKNL
jgi:hypothetical protein